MISMPEVASSEQAMKVSEDFSIERRIGGKCAALSPREAQPATAILRRRSKERPTYGRYIIASIDQVDRNYCGSGFDAQCPQAKFDQIGVLAPLQAAQYSADGSVGGDANQFRRLSSNSIASTAASTAASSDSKFFDSKFLQHTFCCEAQKIRDDVGDVAPSCNLQTFETEGLMARCLLAKGVIDRNAPCSEPRDWRGACLPKASLIAIEPYARQNVVPLAGAGFGRSGLDTNGNNFAKTGATILEQKRNQFEKKVPAMGKAMKSEHTGMRRRQERLAAELDSIIS